MPQSSSSSPELARVAAHRGLDGQRVLAQALALRVLGQQRPGGVADCIDGSSQAIRVRLTPFDRRARRHGRR